MRRLVYRKGARNKAQKAAPRPKMTITKGDTVEIVRGNDRGKRGTVLQVDPVAGRIVVEGINERIKHLKPGPQSEGGRITKPLPIHHSNAMLVDPKTGETTRVRLQRDKDGTVERLSVKSGQSIPRKR